MASDNKSKMRIRMYRQGVGDCFLLTFNPEDVEEKKVHMLVDCGTVAKGDHGVELSQVIDDIQKETRGHVHILVATHEHRDHVAGFNLLEDSGKRKFDAFRIDEAWLAWTENRADVKSSNIPKGRIKDDTLGMLKLTEEKLYEKTARTEEEERILRDLSSANELLKLGAGMTPGDNLFGVAGSMDPPLSVDGAMKYAASKNSQFFSPGDTILPKNENLAKSWRFYVLGPPKDYQQLRKVDDKDKATENEKELYVSAGNFAASARYLTSDLSMAEYRKHKLDAEAREQFDRGFPFDACFRIDKELGDDRYELLSKTYESEDWRCIDYDWLAPVSDFALAMDSLTNNTSLVLAIECLDDKEEERRVLLFPGDAQLGNWETWDGSLNPVKFPKYKTDSVDLLKRTVFYKVGHHSSHNATTKRGLALMNMDEKISQKQKLVAMIPVDSKAASGISPGWNMPDAELYKELLTKTEGRVLRSDVGWPYVKDKTDVKQKPPLWDDKNKKSWADVRDDIQKYQAEIMKLASFKENKYVYGGADYGYRIEYQVASDALGNSNEIPNPKGEYIDYFLY